MKKTIKLLFLLCILVFLYCYLNHLRMMVMKRYTVKSSQIEHIETIAEGKFEVELYKCDRTFYKHWLTLSQKVFSDKIMVIKIPIRQFKVKSIIKTANSNLFGIAVSCLVIGTIAYVMYLRAKTKIKEKGVVLVKV